MKRLPPHLKAQLNRGFTLLEMLVVLGIIMLITVLVLANNGRLNSSVLVSNAAYEVGLMIRESQIAGLGVRATKDNATGAAVFTSSHGIYASMSDPSKFILFSDGGSKDGIYNASMGELYQEYTLQKKAGTILAICTKKDLGNLNAQCKQGVPAGISAVNIVFTRPNPEAYFMIEKNFNGHYQKYSGGIVINIGFEGDVCRSITVEKTGSVQVDSSYCPPAN